MRAVLFFDDPLDPSIGGRFIPRLITQVYFFAFRALCVALISIHLNRSSPNFPSAHFITWTSLYFVIHIAILIYTQYVSSPRATKTQSLPHTGNRLLVAVVLSHALLDVLFGTLIAFAYSSCQTIAINFFFLPVMQASLLGPLSAWLTILITSIGSGIGQILFIPNTTSIFSLFVLATAAFVMRMYRGTQILLRSAINQERSHYESLLEHMPQMITRKDLGGKITYANQAFCKLNGLQNAIGLTDKELYGEDMAQKYLAGDQKVIKTDCILAINEKHRPFGREQEMDVEGSKTPVRDQSGNVVGVQIVFWDVTDRKSWEVRLQALMETTHDFIYFKNAESKFLQISNALGSRLGLSNPLDAIGKSDNDYFSKEYAKDALIYEQRLMQGAESSSDIEEHGRWPNGQDFWVSTKKQCMLDRDGRLIGLFGISRDINQRKANEAALKQVTAQLEVANSRLDFQLGRASEIAHIGIWEFDVKGDGKVAATVAGRPNCRMDCMIMANFHWQLQVSVSFVSQWMADVKRVFGFFMLCLPDEVSFMNFLPLLLSCATGATA